MGKGHRGRGFECFDAHDSCLNCRSLLLQNRLRRATRPASALVEQPTARITLDAEVFIVLAGAAQRRPAFTRVACGRNLAIEVGVSPCHAASICLAACDSPTMRHTLTASYDGDADGFRWWHVDVIDRCSRRAVPLDPASTCLHLIP